MNQDMEQVLQKYAKERGISIEQLEKEFEKLEAKGEIGFGYLRKIIPSEIQNQKDARTLFRMIAQQGEFSDSDEYIESFPNLSATNESEIRRKFSNYVLTRERLQRKNILITPEIWHTLVENPKECMSGRFLKKSVDYSRMQITFSQIYKLPNLENLDGSISHRNNCDALILRTIQFDFLNDSNTYDEGVAHRLRKIDVERMSRYFSAFMSLADERYINNIYEIAECCLDFSIHEHYLPYGFSAEGLKKAVLLMRYDHCSDRHINSILPKYYNMTYANSVALPHFHFNEGLGQVYKLLTKDGKENFGSGFAISVPDLVGYLNQLKAAKSLPQQERDLLLNNDFGMPFLNLMCKDSNGRKTLDDCRRVAMNLCVGNFVEDKSHELQQAYDLINIVNGTDQPSLEEFDIISKQKHNNSEREH